MSSAYSPSGWPATRSQGLSAPARAEMAAIAAGFDKMPDLDIAHALKLVRYNASGTELEADPNSYLPLTGGVLSGAITPNANGTIALGSVANNWSTVFTQIVSNGAATMLSSSGASLRHGFSASWTAQEFAVAGSAKVTMNSSGLGIGLAPASVLQAQLLNETGAGSNQGFSLVGSAGTRQLNHGIDTTNGYPWIQSWVPGSGAGTLVLQPSGGNVTVGGAPGASSLNVRGVNSISSFYSGTARGSGGAYIDIRDPTGVKGYFGYGGGNDTMQVAQLLNAAMEFYTNNTLRESIAASGGHSFFVGTTYNPPSASGAFNTYSIAGTPYGYIGDRTGVVGSGSGLSFRSEGAMYFSTGGASVRMEISSGGVFSYAGNEVGFRGLPAASVSSGAFVAADAGKWVHANAGVTIPNSTMAAGDVVIITNETGSAITITNSLTTAYNETTGTALAGSFSLPARRSISVKFASSTVGYVAGL